MWLWNEVVEFFLLGDIPRFIVAVLYLYEQDQPDALQTRFRPAATSQTNNASASGDDWTKAITTTHPDLVNLGEYNDFRPVVSRVVHCYGFTCQLAPRTRSTPRTKRTNRRFHRKCVRSFFISGLANALKLETVFFFVP